MNGNVVVYQDWIEYISVLTDEQAGQVFKAILLLANGKEPPDMDAVSDMCFRFLKRTILLDNEKYECQRSTRSEAGKKGAEARWQNMANDGKGIAKDGNRINAIKNECDSMAKMPNLKSNNYLIDECITARGRAREDAVISDDDVITTTDGRIIKLKDLEFPEKLKVGMTRR